MFGKPQLDLIRDSLVLLFLGLVVYGNYGEGNFLAGSMGVILFTVWLARMLETLL